jgi:hypothetical protein
MHSGGAVPFDTCMKPNFTGTWKADIARSQFAGASPKVLLAFIAHEGDVLRQEMHATMPDDSEQGILFECSTNGTSHAMLNGNNIRCNAGWNGHELLIETWLELGSRQLHFCDTWWLSEDRTLLSMEHRDGDLEGQFVIFDRHL